MQLESQFKKEFKDDLRRRTIGASIKIIDTSSIRSFPDVLVLGEGMKWAALEFKRRKNSSRQPNQPYYVELLSDMGYAAEVYPSNAEEILDDLAELFTS